MDHSVADTRSTATPASDVAAPIGAVAVPRAAEPGTPVIGLARPGPPIRRKVKINNERVNKHNLTTHLDFEGNRAAKDLLTPIAEDWIKGKDEREFNSAASFRAALVKQLTETWRDEFKLSHPTLYAFLKPTELNTIMYMCRIGRGFDGLRLENALKAAKGAAHVDQASIPKAFSPGKLPPEDAGWGAFSVAWAARIPGTEGLAGELEAAAGVDPTMLQRGQKVRLSSDFDLGATIGGQTTQDADVSFMDSQGQKVLVEVADSVRRLRDKMGVAGSAQRARYDRLRDQDESIVLAYSSPRAEWLEFFTGEAGSSVAEAAVALQPPWGLMIDGQYVSPEELARVTAIIQGAAPSVSGFDEAMDASGITYAQVSAMTPKQLSDRLQRNARH
jgi:hypothetical protein